MHSWKKRLHLSPDKQTLLVKKKKKKSLSFQIVQNIFFELDSHAFWLHPVALERVSSAEVSWDFIIL